jgi:hypothetical protein
MATQNIVLGVENRVGLTSAGQSDWILLDNHRTGNYPIGLSISHNGSTTAFLCSVEYTFWQDPDTAPANAVREHKYLKGLSEATAADELDGNFSVPVTGVRLNVASITGGELYISVIQAGV